MCSAPAFCAWRRLPLICWKLLVGVCVRDGLAASVCVCRSVLLPPVSFFLGVGAPSLSLGGFMFKAAQRGSLSFSLFVVASAACVYETGLLLVCACRTSPASVEPLPRGSRAVAFPRWLHVLSCSTWLIVPCCIDSCVLASLELIVIVLGMNSIRQAASSLLRSLRRCLCCRARRYSCCASSIMIG